MSLFNSDGEMYDRRFESVMTTPLMKPQRTKAVSVKSYRTRFPLNEAPLTEGGKWGKRSSSRPG